MANVGFYLWIFFGEFGREYSGFDHVIRRKVAFRIRKIDDFGCFTRKGWGFQGCLERIFLKRERFALLDIKLIGYFFRYGISCGLTFPILTLCRGVKGKKYYGN